MQYWARAPFEGLSPSWLPSAQLDASALGFDLGFLQDGCVDYIFFQPSPHLKLLRSFLHPEDKSSAVAYVCSGRGRALIEHEYEWNE
eukprot:4097372-Amphidinium_carterae.1